jgi:hypothetical protein
LARLPGDLAIRGTYVEGFHSIEAENKKVPKSLQEDIKPPDASYRHLLKNPSHHSLQKVGIMVVSFFKINKKVELLKVYPSATRPFYS